MYRLFNRKAQSTLEYAVLITVVVGALLAMRHYTSRAIQGRIRSSVDDVGEQYSAGHTTSKYQITHDLAVTKETFGVNPETEISADLTADTAHQGVSQYTIITPGIVTRETGEAGRERIGTAPSGEEQSPEEEEGE